MRLTLLRLLTAASCLFFFSGVAKTQNCIPTNISGGVIDRPCGQLCADINFQIPHIKGTSDYTVNAIPYAAYPYTNASGTVLTSIYIDDKYSPLLPMAFPFCFYGNNYNNFVVGSNGIMTFEQICANASNAYTLTVGGAPQTIPYNGGAAPGGIGTTYYPRTAIMGAYHDIDPSASPLPTRRIEYNVFGTAPCRKLVVSFFDIRMFGSSCSNLICSEQMVLHESTGVIEIFLLNKPLCTSWPSGAGAGLAILGIQDETRTRAVAPPGKNCTQWAESNTGYRFTPSGGGSRFVMSEIYTMGGVLVATADTSTTTPGLLDLSFPNVCVTASTTDFVVRTTFSACDNPANQLISLDTITVNLSTMDAGTSSSSTTCSGASNGSITVDPLTGTAPFTYSLDGAPAVPGPDPYTFTNIPAGPHTVVVYDAFGCVTPSIPVNVTAGPPLTTAVNKTDALCNGGATGTITVTQPSIGTPPFEYSLDGTTWQASNIFNGLPAGAYTVYYRESNGCQGSQSITINQPAVLAAAASSTAASCNGLGDGTITVNGSGGVSPYQYSIDGITWQSGNTFTAGAGNYTVSIRDLNNCITTQNVTITEPAALTALSINTNGTCDGVNDGTITVAASGGNSGGYQYSIDGTTFQSSAVFNVNPGNYTVTVKDNLGCTTSFPATVGLTSNLTLTPQADALICEGRTTQLELLSNGTQYDWSPSTGLSNPAIYNPVASPTVTTQYIVTTTLGRCSEQDTVIVNVNPAPVPDAGPDGYICYGQTYQLQGSGGTQYAWSPSTYLDNDQVANPVSSATRDMVYTLSILSDINGCASLVTDDMRLDVTPPIKVTTFPFDTVAYNGDVFQLMATTNDSDVINYSWTPATGLSDPYVASPMVTAGAIGDVVQYQVTTSTLAGCKGFGYVTVRVYKGPDIYMPTAFTPNNDGRNDRFTPFPVGIQKLNYFRVYNRWGQLLFTTNQLHHGWDGRLQGIEQQTGTYVWMVEGLTLDNRVITKKGTVTLIR